MTKQPQTDQPQHNDLTSGYATAALLKIAEITSTTPDIDEMLERAVREVALVLDVEGAILMMPDASSASLIPHNRSRYGLATKLPFLPLALDGPGHMVHVYHTGQPYVSNEPPSDPNIERQNVLTYPLNSHDRTLGILSLINRKPAPFDDSSLKLVRGLASQIATSLENVQLFARERARADLMSLTNTISQELTATLDLPGLMRKVVDAIHERFGYDMVSIMLLDENNENVAVEASISTLPDISASTGISYPVGHGIVGRAIASGETQLIPDIQEDADSLLAVGDKAWGSALVVPLRARTRILGAIEALVGRPNGFQEADRFAMETLAAQVSIAIENGRLWNQAQRQLLEQGIVHQIGQDLTSILDYSELVNAVVQHMTRALDSALCLLISYEPESGNLAIEAEYRPTTSDQNTGDFPISQFVGQPISPHERDLVDGAILSRRQVILYRDGAGVSAAQQQYMHRTGIYAELVLPMIAGDRIIGSMVWIENRAPREFTDSDVRLAQTLTTQAAIAIENARLYRQAQRQAREQALLRRIAVSLSTMPDVESLVRQLAYEVAEALEVDHCVISLRDEAGLFPIAAYYPTNQDPEATLLGHFQTDPDLPAIVQSLEAGLTVSYHSGTSDSSAAVVEVSALLGAQDISLLLVPIIRRGETVGVVEISSANAKHNFDQKETQLLEAIANQGAVAIDNVTLAAREQRRLRQLEKLQVSSRNISGYLQTDALLNAIVREAAAIFDAPAVSLMTKEPGNDDYVTRAAVGLSDDYVARRHVRLTEYRQADNRPQYSTSPSRLSDEQQNLFTTEGLVSVLSVALIKADQHLGILNLYSKTEPRHFTDEEYELTQLFASQAATAFENARLFKALEDRAIELTKVNKLKSEFLARISHELRTPMNSINGYSEMLIQAIYGELNAKQADRVERILRNGRNLLALIDDLLDISKIDAGKMEMQIAPVDLNEELKATISNLESQAIGKGLYLNLEVPADLPRVQADSMRLKQIITNLLGNAVKFTQYGGVTVTVQVMDIEGKSMIATAVSDTGIGIKSEDQEIIFDEFRQADGSATREYGGTGLGLAIVKKLVEMMDGRIWVESEVGAGSKFTVLLPAAPANY